MKKTFKTFALMLAAVLAFSSCADIPAPYNMPEKDGRTGGGSSVVAPAGDGTLASPYNVAAIVAMVKEMEAGVESTEEYYIKGKVLAVTTTEATIAQYGNHTFTMVDEGNNSTVFTAFQVYGPGKKKFTSVNDIKVGDEVVVCGKVVNFKGNTPETVGKGSAYVVSINSSGSGEQTAKTVTCAEAVELTNALADGGTSAETYSVTGYITEVVGNVSRNQQTFWMADTKDGGKVFEAYWANLPEGVSEFKVGMKVTITGQLMKYVKGTDVTPEIKNADVVILEDGGGVEPGPGPEPGGDPVTDLVNGNFENWDNASQPTGWKSASTASSSELSQSTDAHGGSYSCKITAAKTVSPDKAANQRLATQEITLEAGTYTFSYYAKATTGEACQTRPGFVPVTSESKVGTYKYGDYVNINNSAWTLVSYDFTLESATTICLIVMNPKDSSYSVSQDILVDDATLVKK